MLADEKDHAEGKKENSNQGGEKQDDFPDEEDGEEDVPKHSRIPFPFPSAGRKSTVRRAARPQPRAREGTSRRRRTMATDPSNPAMSK